MFELILETYNERVNSTKKIFKLISSLRNNLKTSSKSFETTLDHSCSIRLSTNQPSNFAQSVPTTSNHVRIRSPIERSSRTREFERNRLTKRWREKRNEEQRDRKKLRRKIYSISFETSIAMYIVSFSHRLATGAINLHAWPYKLR